ncbi:putative amidase-like protein [Lentzea atacamensis]|uniref:Putative amidase-like protein n=1 Tax=Lentzea atacamensis TaxID=531938 RepID=A0A316ICX7_9PSEU|nr:amidase domain-containing protein [Lentzea atacamensis]PWK91372.1 putative amidase-like protein [Lentzea atacamensis]
MATALGASPAAADSGEITADDRARLTSLAQRYLQDRADRLTDGDGLTTQRLTTVPTGTSVEAKLAKDRTAIDARRSLLRKVNGGHHRAEVALLDVTFEARGSTVDVAFTEHTKLYFVRTYPGAPTFEEYGLQRRLSFTSTASGWLLAGDVTDLGDSVMAPDTDPAAATPVSMKAASPSRPSAATTRPTGAQLNDATKNAIKPGLKGTDASSAAYDYVAMLNYANRYWGPTEAQYNHAYRSYAGAGEGGDCTNFLSQIVGAGGWTTVGSWPWEDRTDNKNWFYGDYTWTTSYSWAAAENWYWFAAHESGRTSYIDNVWKLWVTDVLQVDFDRNDNISHSMFVTDRVGSGEWASEVYLTYHSGREDNKHNRPLSSFIATHPDAWYYAHRT